MTKSRKFKKSRKASQFRKFKQSRSLQTNLLNSFDMECNNVPTFEGVTDKFIDPNIKGQLIHSEIKTALTDEVYKSLKILLTKNTPELDEHLRNEPIKPSTTLSLREQMAFHKTKKAWVSKMNDIMDRTPTQFDSPEQFCENFDFNDEEPPLSTGNKIPLLETINGKQVVLGREKNLTDYYIDKDKFISLHSKYWDTTGHLNDVFIECAKIKMDGFNNKNKFPIRIVLSPELFKETNNKLKITKYNTNYTKTTVLSKELCQFLNYTTSSLYQSREYPNIFFISRSDITHDKKKFIKISNEANRGLLTYKIL
jgi:hypothetical protein